MKYILSYETWPLLDIAYGPVYISKINVHDIKECENTNTPAEIVNSIDSSVSFFFKRTVFFMSDTCN